MGDFFHGWRRKAGVVTLLMAFTLVVGWVRSLNTVDRLYWRTGTQKAEIIVSVWGRLLWEESSPYQPVATETPNAIYNVDGTVTIEFINVDRFYSTYRSTPAPDKNRGMASNPFFDEWNVSDFWQQCGFVFRSSSEPWSRFWAIPYWSMVIPLTMLSAYLLLAKRRKQKPLTTPNVSDAPQPAD